MSKSVENDLISELKSRFKDHSPSVEIPPPSYIAMGGNVVHYDNTKGLMEIIFPVKTMYMNPFHSMQGGMIAAAIDNTFGPLSMLVAPLNFTRQLEIKYKKQIGKNIRFIKVVANLVKRDKRKLYFEALVLDMENNELANAKAIHWIVKQCDV